MTSLKFSVTRVTGDRSRSLLSNNCYYQAPVTAKQLMPGGSGGQVGRQVGR